MDGPVICYTCMQSLNLCLWDARDWTLLCSCWPIHCREFGPWIRRPKHIYSYALFDSATSTRCGNSFIWKCLAFDYVNF